MTKLGQFLSSRADLLPEQALAVLASTGEEVAVKVQRPHIEQLVRMDLNSLKFVIRVITRFVKTGTFLDLKGIYREFERTVYEEIDFVREAANCKRFHEMSQDDPTIYIPAVYDDYTTRRVLVLEWIDGIKINDYKALEAAGIDRLEVANRTVQAYFHQFFDEGFFHADPHPGNIFVKRGTPGAGPIIEFVDFGMVGALTKSMMQAMRALFLSFLTRDSEAMVQALAELGFIGKGANVAAIERGLSLVLEQFYGMTLGEVRELDVPVFVDEIGKLLYGEPFQIPAQFTFTGRAISTLVGVSTGLAPDFNFIEVAAPYARKFMGVDTEGIGRTIQQLLSQLLETVNTLLKMPNTLERILTKLEAGQFVINLGGDIGIGTTAFRRRENNSAQAAFPLALALMFIACLGAAVFFLHNDRNQFMALITLGLAAFLGLRLFLRW